MSDHGEGKASYEGGENGVVQQSKGNFSMKFEPCPNLRRVKAPHGQGAMQELLAVSVKKGEGDQGQGQFGDKATRSLEEKFHKGS